MKIDVGGITSTVQGNTTSINTLNGTVATHTENISTINQTMSGLSSTVSSHTTDINTLNGTVAGHSTSISQISQKADSISLRVETIEDSYLTSSDITGDKLVASINLQPGTVQIDAKNINLNGYATFSDLPSKTSELENDSNYQNSDEVESAITSKGYQTASDVSKSKVEASHEVYYLQYNSDAPAGPTK